MSVIAVFPGQGSQYTKMGKDFYDNFQIAKNVFLEVDDALNFKLSSVIFGDSEDELKQTHNTQPALMAVSIAIAEVLKSQKGFDATKTSYTAGHSLGEYSALCFAKSISLRDTSILLKHRGSSMNMASNDYFGAMAALIGGDDDKINSLIDFAIKNSNSGGSDAVLVAANDNSVGQVVISGSKQSVELAVSNAKSYGIKLATILPVSGAFHSPLMKNATTVMQDILGKVSINAPIIPVIQNVTASKVSSPDEIKQNLVKQIESSVKWRQTMLYAQENGVTNLVEIGAKNVLCGLAKRTTPSINAISIEKVSDIDKIDSMQH